MQERGPRQPLNKQERFVLSNISQGLTMEELREKIETARKDSSGIFPEFFGHSMFDSLVNGLLSKGLIKRVDLISTEQGKKELEDDQRRRIIRPEPRPIPRRAEPITRELPKPAPQVRPAEPARIEKKEKPPKIRLKSLSDLGKHFPDESVEK